jgi:hypothetical protein
MNRVDGGTYPGAPGIAAPRQAEEGRLAGFARTDDPGFPVAYGKTQTLLTFGASAETGKLRRDAMSALTGATASRFIWPTCDSSEIAFNFRS